MKILCSKDSLLTGVNTVQRAVSNKNNLPILQGILLKAETQFLHFAATDLEMGIRCQVNAQVIEEGHIVVPAKLFSEIVRKLPDTTISLILNDESLTIEYYNSVITIKGFDPEEFPLLPDLFDPISFTLPTDLFKNMIRQTVFACALEESRPVFTGILMQIENQTIRLVATDTHRLAYKVAEIPNENELEFSGIIPAKTMSEIYRLLKDEEESLNISFNEAQVAFQFGTVNFISRLIDGQFPNYKQVIPKNCETKTHVSVREFMEAVERASLLARDGSIGANIVRLKIDSSSLKIEQASEIGKISEQVVVDTEGNEVSIAFNSKFLLDVLRVAECDEIVFELSGSYSPGVIKPINDPNYLCLVLPVRTS